MKIFGLMILAAAAFTLASGVLAQTRLTPHKITLSNKGSVSLNLPENYEIIPAAGGLKRVRFFAKAPDGRIFVTDMYNLADNKRGAVYILEGFDAATGKFARVIPYMTGLRNPNSCQFYRDADGQWWFYLAETHQLTRRKFTLKETKPGDTRPQVLATFPDYGLSYKYGGWHLTRTLSFSPDGRLYVSVGSSCNACIEKEKVRASIISMEPDGSDQHEFARGLRNAVGLRAIGKFVFATNQGADHLGLNKPDETFYALKEGTDYGWPYCYSSAGRIFADPKFKRPDQCANVPEPYAYFPAHSSALGFDYFDDADADPLLKGGFVVSLHGSTNKAVGHGYKIVIMRKGQKLEDLITGFLDRGRVNGRPCDVMKINANSFLFTDDDHGIVYLVRKKGTTPNIISETTSDENVTPARTASNTAASPKTDPQTSPPGSSCIGAFLIITAAAIGRLAI